jgi:hypothetical protein
MARLVWGEDPIFPLPIGYDKMAVGVKLVEERSSKRRQNEAAKRPRVEQVPRNLGPEQETG